MRCHHRSAILTRAEHKKPETQMKWLKSKGYGTNAWVGGLVGWGQASFNQYDYMYMAEIQGILDGHALGMLDLLL